MEVSRILKTKKVFRFQLRGTIEKTPESSTSTVIGVSFLPEEANEMLANSGMELLWETGQSTQYHWITCRKKTKGGSSGKEKP